MVWPFTRSRRRDVSLPIVPTVTLPAVERRSSMSGFTAEILSARSSYLAGRSGLGELTSTVQACVDLWSNGFGIAKVDGTDLLGHREMAMVGRSLAVRGESLWLIRGDRLIAASDWDIATKDGQPRAYRLSISESGGGTTTTALAGEVLHFRIGVDAVTPWAGSSPLRRSSLTASMLHAIESALAETWEGMPFGSQIVPFPEAAATDMTALGRSFRGQRGKVMLRESVAVTAAGGPTPAVDWRPADTTPSLERAMPVQSLDAARNGIALAYGVLPALLDSAATGPAIRECQRHLATFCLQPIGETIAEEASMKLGGKVELDLIEPLQAYDTGASARSFKTMVDALVAAKEAGLSDAAVAGVLGKLDWTE